MANLYRFDDVEIDLGNFRVLKAGKSLSLEPKAFNVLVFLVENRGRLIEKKELIDAVWGDAFVTENVLTRVIGQLRKGLGDDVKEARYIETVPTRGYRFIADTVAEGNGAAQTTAAEISATVESSATPVSTSIAPTRAGLRPYAIAVIAVIILVAVAAVAISIARSRSISANLQIASSTQITTSSGLSFYPTFSPDATEIAYSTDRGKGFEVFVRQLAAGGKEVQITSDGEQNLQPAWSPDGNLIAYYSRMRGGIWLIPALGGTARKVTEFGSHPAWSRDGKWIAFQSSLLDDFGADAMGANPTSTVWVVRTDGTDLRQLTTLGNPDGGHGSPSWSPDGKHIVFASSLSGQSKGVWAIGADGTGLTQLVATSFGHYDPVYTPDGNSVVYGAVAVGHDFGLWQVHVSPDTSAAVGPPTEITNSGGTRLKNLAFSSDGKKLIYAAVSLTGSLVSLPISKSAEPAGEPVTLTSEVGCREILPSISPDGSRIAFVSCHGRAGISQQIWIMNLDGSNLQQLTFPPSTGAFPSWYPDGRRILVSTWNGSDGNVISVDADTREQKVIMKIGRDSMGPELSPDGRQGVMFFSENGIINTWVLDMETGQKKQITFDKEMAAYPSWSPDGKFIAYQIARGEDNGIFILPSTGGAPTQITPIHGQHWSYSWSPDGDKVIFARPGDDLNWNIWSVSRSTKIEKQLTHYTKRNAFVRYPATSPKGNQIVYEYTETTGNIWMMEFK